MKEPKEIAKLHTPVMLRPTIDLLEPALNVENPVLLDCTLGMGGHSEAFLEKFANLQIIAIDRDQEAIKLAAKRLASFSERVSYQNTTYDQISEVLAIEGIQAVNAILMDLGVSSLQLDARERGFSYSQDAPLDMRMTDGAESTASDIINHSSEDALIKIFAEYGEEPLAKRYARAIVKTRETKDFQTSAELVDVLQQATPYSKRDKGHPAKRVFQALRIAVNDELHVLEVALPVAAKSLKVGGRLIVMSYHSLEDRMVKRFFKDICESKTPSGVPMEIPGLEAKFSPVVRGQLSASEEEQIANPRSKPARLRAIERVGE